MNSLHKFLPYLLIILFFYSCIGDDIIDDEVDPVLKIANPIDTLAFDSSYQFELIYLNNVGREAAAGTVTWTSSDPIVIEVNNEGLANALTTGADLLRAEKTVDGRQVGDEIFVNVGEETIVSSTDARTGSLLTTSRYLLKGDFTLAISGQDLVLSFDSNYRASDRLPGLFIYLTNNQNTNSGALEIGEVKIFSGAHSYILPTGVELNDYSHVLYYCKPFTVKVGGGPFDN